MGLDYASHQNPPPPPPPPPTFYYCNVHVCPYILAQLHCSNSLFMSSIQRHLFFTSCAELETAIKVSPLFLGLLNFYIWKPHPNYRLCTHSSSFHNPIALDYSYYPAPRMRSLYFCRLLLNYKNKLTILHQHSNGIPGN